jgi:hypothetical protein
MLAGYDDDDDDDDDASTVWPDRAVSVASGLGLMGQAKAGEAVWLPSPTRSM